MQLSLLLLCVLLGHVACYGNTSVQPLTVGQRVLVNFTVAYPEHYISIGLCRADPEACNIMRVLGSTASGEMKYTISKGCRMSGWGCEFLSKEWHEPRGGENFSLGKVDLVVERQQQGLGVWLKGRPEHTATMLAGEDHGQLLIEY